MIVWAERGELIVLVVWEEMTVFEVWWMMTMEVVVLVGVMEGRVTSVRAVAAAAAVAECCVLRWGMVKAAKG